MRPRVVADTNGIVSAFASGGNPKAILLLAASGAIEVFASEAILEEVTRVLTGPKFCWTHSRLVDAVTGLPARIIDPGPSWLAVVRDHDDNRILECAVAARAHYLVTGDRDLLTLERSFARVS
ncbi:MAG: putative toxin-antitoxin system toxin component, PIN family [Deltaproteobacteria bacterium]|nr:putative toxin-antitoxin system toxin component, PIN family [Deltaproteobacteria bacterium]